MPDLLIGSGNKKKLAELQRILSPLGFNLLAPTDLDPIPGAPEETGETFEENAEQKARYYSECFRGGLALADDSGLVVPALDGAPGVRSARYAGEDASDADNNRKLLEAMAEMEGDRRRAHFVASIAVVKDGRVVCRARGTCEGRILSAERGEGGFGYDPLFLVEGGDETFAELEHERKSAVSHRGRALATLESELRAWLERDGAGA